jgi:two-component system, NtrC family, sensor histidine kinase HydH
MKISNRLHHSMKKNFYIKPRFIVLVGLTIALVMVVGSYQRSQQSEVEIHSVLEEEAYSLIETIDHSSMNIILSSDEIERQITGRLLTAGRLIARLDSAGFLQPWDLKRIAEENKIFRINIFDRRGRRVLSNHVPDAAHQTLMQRGSPQETLKPLFQGKVDQLIIGTKKARFEPGERFAVAVRRTKQGGGAVVLNTDITDFTELKKNIGIGKLIRDLGNNSGIEYAALQDMDGIIVASDSVDQLSSFVDDTTLGFLWKKDTTLTRQASFHHRDVYEVLKPLSIEQTRVGIIRIGLSLDEVRSIERQGRQRNVMRTLVLIFVAFLTISALIATQNYRLSRQRISAMESFTGSILEQMRDAVITIDREKRITIFNHQAEELFEVKEKDVIGKNLDKLSKSNSECLARIFIPAEPELTLEFTPGKVRTVAVSLSTTNKTDGLMESQTVVIKDLTEARRMEREIQRKEKLTAMGELASGVAHEIRNPLNAISMIAQRFEHEFKPRSAVKEYHSLTQVLKKETARVNGIIQQFLKFARPPKIKLMAVSAKEFTAHIAALFESQAISKGVIFSNRCDTEEFISIDSEQMTQALLNLLQNALDATKKGRSISLKTFQKEKFIVFEIKDAGSGITADKLEKIFNLYFTTKTDGNGMGLAITQQIVSQHNGNIEVHSEIGRGTIFSIFIPHEQKSTS